jgi:hypothetical protein
MWGIDCAFPNSENASLIQENRLYIEVKMKFFASIHIDIPESGSGEHFQGSGTRAIDSPHKITPKGSFLEKIFGPKIM